MAKTPVNMHWRLAQRRDELIYLLGRVVAPNVPPSMVADLATFLLETIEERAENVPTHSH